MEEKQLLKAINEESKSKVPNVYNKVFFKAQSQGLLNTSSETEAYSDGETVVLGGVNKKAIAITTLAALAAVSLAIALPIALSGNFDGGLDIPPFGDGGNKVVADIDFGDSYSYGAVTASRLAERLLGEPVSAKAMSKTIAASSVSESNFEGFGAYFSALDCLVGDNALDRVEADKHDEYQKSIALSGQRLNGDKFSYAMYYTEYKIVSESYVSGNPVNYYLEGIISLSRGGRISLIGERTLSSDAADAKETALTLNAYPNLNDKTTYAQMKLQTEVIDGASVQSYTYKIVKSDSAVSEAVAYKPSDADLVIKIKEGDKNDGTFTVVGKEEGGDGYKVNYDFGGIDKGSMTVRTSDNGFEYELPEENPLLGYKDNGDGTYTVSTYNKNVTMPETLVIPATYRGKPVVSIDAGALRSIPSKKIVISEGITEIKNEALAFSKVEEVEFPSTLESIGRKAFESCVKLKQLNLPASLKQLDTEAFGGCSALTEVNIPNGVQSIGSMAFTRCSGLVSVSLPASLTDLQDGAFSSCRSLEKITVAKGNSIYYSVNNCVIKTENKWVVAGCKTSVIPADGSVTKIGNYAFYNNGLTALNLPASVDRIYDYAFAENLFTSVTLPEGVYNIGMAAFENCRLLERLSLPTALASISRLAFYGCSKLEAVNLPANVRFMGDNVFAYCASLSSLTVDENNTDYYSEGNCIISSYGVVTVGCNTSVIPEEGVRAIGDGAFVGSGIERISIPYNVTWIQAGAFMDSALNEIIMVRVRSIDDGAFQSCWNLENVILSPELSSIGRSAFEGCYNLHFIDLPEGLTDIGEYAFHDSGLQEVRLPSSVKTVEGGVFERCGILHQVTLREGVTRVYSCMFKNCQNLEIVDIPKTVTNIDFQASYGCKKLKTINFNGTKAEWEAIEKDTYTWDYEIGPYKVVCTDGEIAPGNS